MIAIFKKAGGWLAQICGGLAIVWLLLAWVEFQTNKRVAAARAEGKAQCEAEIAKHEIIKLNQAKEKQRNEEVKKAAVWASPNLDDDDILRLFDKGQL